MRKIAVVLAGVALAAPALAQNQEQEQIAAAAQTFVAKAASGGLEEVTLGRMALERGQSPEIRAFGRQLVEDHSKNYQKLEQTAGRLGVSMPSEPSPEQQQEIAQMRDTPQDRFDKAFAKMAVKNHQNAVDLYRREAQTANAPALKDYAQASLPTLEEHLRAAQSLEK